MKNVYLLTLFLFGSQQAFSLSKMGLYSELNLAMSCSVLAKSFSCITVNLLTASASIGNTNSRISKEILSRMQDSERPGQRLIKSDFENLCPSSEFRFCSITIKTDITKLKTPANPDAPVKNNTEPPNTLLILAFIKDLFFIYIWLF